jgi:hypothetical protein
MLYGKPNLEDETMTNSTLAPQPISSSPRTSSAAHEEVDKARKNNSGTDGACLPGIIVSNDDKIVTSGG